MAAIFTGEHPYSERLINNLKERTFDTDGLSEDLVWHRDRLDRTVKVIDGADWYLQLDDHLPKKLIKNQCYFIPAMVFHRLIKGKTTLKIEIRE